MTIDVDGVFAQLKPGPFWYHLGAELLEVSPGRSLVRVPTRREFERSGGFNDGSAHGGIVASVIDMAASCALITVLRDGETRSTIDLSVHYLSPARGDLSAVAEVRRRGGRTAVIDIELTCEGQLVALGRAVFAIIPAH